MPSDRAETKPDEFYSILSPLMKASSEHHGQVVAIVGGGGKTAVLFALAAAALVRGLSVAVTTTTHIRDPRLETGRHYDHLVLLNDAGHGELKDLDVPGICVVATGVLEAEGRLRGIDTGLVAVLRRHFDLVLVEADGSRGLPIKAPGAHEPAMPPDADLVIGVVGLDCLGKPMDEATVHRPGLFGPLCGCAPGESLGIRHIVALCQAGDGLFKLCPPGAARVLLLNKADLLSTVAGVEVAGDRVAGDRVAGDSDAGDSDAGNQLAWLYRELRVLRACLDGYLVCSLEPGFRYLHGSI